MEAGWRALGTAPDLTRVVWCGKEQRLVFGLVKAGVDGRLRLKRSSHNRFHHLVKTFWGWHDQQLADGTIIWTSPSGNTYVTTHRQRAVVPSLCQATGECPHPKPPRRWNRAGSVRR